jgi:hypothetical protein
MRLCVCINLQPDCYDCLEYAKKEIVNISKRIILHKAIYYYPEKFSTSTINKWEVNDNTYDSEEKWYLMLCKLLNHPNMLVHDLDKTSSYYVPGPGMMEVDFTRADVIQALKPFIKDN